MAISKVLDYKNLLAGFMIILACLLTGCSAKTIDNFDCDDLGEMAIGEAFEFLWVKAEVLKVLDSTEVSRSGWQCSPI